MKVKTALVVLTFGFIGFGIWDIRDGSFDMFAGKYAQLRPYSKKMPFDAMFPSYIPFGFKFQKDQSVGAVLENSAGIPQLNFYFETKDEEEGIVVRQFDRQRYESDILKQGDKRSLEEMFLSVATPSPVQKGGNTLYMHIPSGKTRTFLGDLDYGAYAYMLNPDSVIQVNYVSNKKQISEDMMMKILLSMKPF
ncbi:MAG: hypothetical protein Q8P52_00210 [bacterium]|nr:hypothetical protein [bacterium]